MLPSPPTHPPPVLSEPPWALTKPSVWATRLPPWSWPGVGGPGCALGFFCSTSSYCRKSEGRPLRCLLGPPPLYLQLSPSISWGLRVLLGTPPPACPMAAESLPAVLFSVVYKPFRCFALFCCPGCTSVLRCFSSFLFNLFFYWRIAALQNSVVFCQTSTWVSRRYTYIPCLLDFSLLSSFLWIRDDSPLPELKACLLSSSKPRPRPLHPTGPSCKWAANRLGFPLSPILPFS